MKNRIFQIFCTLLVLGFYPGGASPAGALPSSAKEPRSGGVAGKEEAKAMAPRTPAMAARGMALYRGSWFDIQYPKNFTASPVAPVARENGVDFVETDEATFVSPDKKVAFFVFSPLWSGEPKSYLRVGPGEEPVSRKSSERGHDGTRTVFTWVTIRATDGSYSRSYVSVQNYAAHTHQVFGIKYRDDAAYRQYRDAYIAFKASLQQYAD